jgi:hypothetical protein
MGNTPIYGFGYIEPNQDLSENIDLDELRFRSIENQMYNLYQIFKNGIIESDPNTPSWRIQTYANDFKLTKILVTAGEGFVSYKAARTSASKDVSLPLLPADISVSRVFVYAYENDETVVSGDVSFVASLTQINDTVNYIPLGFLDIDVNTASISLDESTRQDITLFSSLSSVIKNHKHIGGSGNPAPIDLSEEVQNQITSENISNVDASKITTGILDSARLPEISHNSLSQKGNLSHEQLESLLLDLSNNNSSNTLSELSIANRLQMLIALKKQSGSGYSHVDSTQINTIVYVPGIYPNNSNNASTGTSSGFAITSGAPNKYTLATVYNTAPYSSGNAISNSVSTSTFVGDKPYVTLTELNQARIVASSIGSTLYNYYNNIAITGSATSGSFSIDTPINYRTLAIPSASIFNTSDNWNSGLVFTNSYSSNKLKVDTGLYTYKLFDTPISLEYNSKIGIGFSAGLGETGAALGKIYMYLVVGTGGSDPNLSSDLKVEFAPNTGTATTAIYISPATNKKIFDDAVYGTTGSTSTYQSFSLSDFGDSTLTKSVLGYGFYFATDQGWSADKQIKFELLTPSESVINPDNSLDDLIESRRAAFGTTSSLFVWNDLYTYKNANFLFRFDSGDVNTQYNQVQYEVDLPLGTKYTLKSRSNINSEVFYNVRTVSETDVIIVTPNTNSGTGRYFDLLFSMYSNENQNLTPSFSNIKINYSAVGTGLSRIYDRNLTDNTINKFGWVSDAYSTKNIGYGTTNPDSTNYLSIYDTSKVGNWVYLRNNTLISATSTRVETTVEDGIDNSTLAGYLTPRQIFNKSTSYGFDTPKDYQALSNGGNIICDTFNDRIVITDINGNFTKVIQGNIRLRLQSRDFVALSATFNPTTRKIFIAFSQNISFVDLTKIFITYDNITIRADDTRITSDYLDPILGNSATYVLTMSDTVDGRALASAISNANTKKIRLDKGCFTNSGTSINTTDVLSATIPESTISSVNRTEQFYAGISTSLTGTITTAIGISSTSQSVSAITDYNGDGSVSLTALYGPYNQVDDIQLDLLKGPIYFSNIYNPISVQFVEEDGSIVIAQPHSNSVVSYKNNDNLDLNWAVTSDVVKFYDNKVGSAYRMSNGKLLLASPAVDSLDTGKLQVYNITNGFIETKLTFNNDVVKALPGPATDFSNFYVLTDDVVNFGENSRLHLVNTSGTILSTWGDNNELFHPKGLRITGNDTILISE